MIATILSYTEKELDEIKKRPYVALAIHLSGSSFPIPIITPISGMGDSAWFDTTYFLMQESDFEKLKQEVKEND